MRVPPLRPRPRSSSALLGPHRKPPRVERTFPAYSARSSSPPANPSTAAAPAPRNFPKERNPTLASVVPIVVCTSFIAIAIVATVWIWANSSISWRTGRTFSSACGFRDTDCEGWVNAFRYRAACAADVHALFSAVSLNSRRARPYASLRDNELTVGEGTFPAQAPLRNAAAAVQRHGCCPPRNGCSTVE